MSCKARLVRKLAGESDFTRAARQQEVLFGIHERPAHEPDLAADTDPELDAGRSDLQPSLSTSPNSDVS